MDRLLSHLLAVRGLCSTVFYAYRSTSENYTACIRKFHVRYSCRVFDGVFGLFLFIVCLCIVFYSSIHLFISQTN